MAPMGIRPGAGQGGTGATTDGVSVFTKATTTPAAASTRRPAPGSSGGRGGQAPRIRLDQVSKAYTAGGERVVALDQVDLAIRGGELMLVVGPSGSGKTTLVHVASGLTRPDTGRVLVGGRELNLRQDKAISRLRNEHLGFVFQKAHFIPHLSVRENVELPMTIAGIRPRQRRRRALACLRSVGLDGVAKRRIGELSGGQQQRVSIARALTRRPAVLFADEPTGNLDSARSREVLDLLRSLCDERGVAVVVVTHNEAFTAMADRVVAMFDGTLTEVSRADR